MVYLALSFILYSIHVFGALDGHFSIGEILLICLKVVALALFLVDVLVLVVVFFIIRLSSSPQLEAYFSGCAKESLQEAGTDGGTVEFVNLAEPEGKPVPAVAPGTEP